MKLSQSIISEFESHTTDKVNDGVLTNSNKDDWHFHLFNEDYYIIGYAQAEDWMIEHGINSFEATNACVEYEMENFGGVSKTYDNAETVANMLAYILGEQWMGDGGTEFIETIIAED